MSVEKVGMRVIICRKNKGENIRRKGKDENEYPQKR